MYTNKVLSHFKDPQNMGKIDNADGIGEVGNVVCGDLMRLYIKIKDNVLEDVKFETYGCVAAISTSSALTTMAKGKTIEQALQIKNEDIVKELQDLPRVKVHCSLLATDALHEAIYDYLKKQGKEIPAELERTHKKVTLDKCDSYEKCE